MSSERFRIQESSKLMAPGDPEPPALPSSAVLNTAKHSYVDSLSLDKNPIIALAKAKREGETSEQLSIRNIGYDPFFCHYWTNFQLTVYKKYAKAEKSCLKIDASGKIVSKIKRSDGSLSQAIFLYLVVVNYEDSQFPVSQMISEAHDTGAIQCWLLQWIRSGAPPPKETVTDSSRALLTAIVRTFASYSSIEKYCDAFFKTDPIDCYIRIDVAHFIKIYVGIVKDQHRLVKKFFLGVMGLLILSTSLEDARTLIKSVLIVSMSETEGRCIESDSDSVCYTHKNILINLITGHPENNDIIEEINETPSIHEQLEDRIYLNSEIDLDQTDNSWSMWANEIKDEVESILEIGSEPNAYYCPSFTKHLLSDLRHLPMWTSIYRDKFGYGRVPASSASVEGEFNKLKNVIFKNELGQKRVDQFVQDHVQILEGQMNIIQAKLNHDIDSTSENVESHADAETSENVIQIEPESCANNRKRRHSFANNNPAEIKCPACINGHFPTGAHKCHLCNKAVHIFQECSMPLEGNNEGYGEKRLCLECHSSDSTTQIIASRYQENWGGLINEPKNSKRSNLYLNNKKHLMHAFTFSNNKDLPILKNGSLGFGAVTKNNCTKTVKNTCAFDSLAQVILFIFAENKEIQKAILSCDNAFLQFCAKLLSKGLSGPHLYKERTLLLHNYFEKNTERLSTIHNCSSLNCSIRIPYMILTTFRNNPSITEISICQTHGCFSKTKLRTTVILLYEDIFKKNFNRIVTEQLILKDRKCLECTSYVKTSLISSGLFMFFEIDLNENKAETQLQRLPTKFKIEINNKKETYKLSGVINFSSPYNRTLRSSDQGITETCATNQIDGEIDEDDKISSTVENYATQIGHYTALCCQSNNWVEYDDLKNQSKKISSSFKCCPVILIFQKQMS